MGRKLHRLLQLQVLYEHDLQLYDDLLDHRVNLVPNHFADDLQAE